jgi:hypothetical protein
MKDRLEKKKEAGRRKKHGDERKEWKLRRRKGKHSTAERRGGKGKK